MRCWHFLKTGPYWRGFVGSLLSGTSQEYLDYLMERHIGCIIAGEDRVDLRAALEELNQTLRRESRAGGQRWQAEWSTAASRIGG